MTNADKYNLTREQARELCYEIARFCNGTVQAGMIMDFFYCPLQPTLTEDERVILRNLPKKFKFINRNAFNEIQLRENSKFEELDYSEAIDELYNHLFQFIKERRRI